MMKVDVLIISSNFSANRNLLIEILVQFYLKGNSCNSIQIHIALTFQTVQSLLFQTMFDNVLIIASQKIITFIGKTKFQYPIFSKKGERFYILSF